MNEPLPLEVEPNFKVDNFGPCPCMCGLEGVYRVKRWKDGTQHVKLCVCRRCVGGRQSPKARTREHKIAKATGGTREPMSGNLSGIDGRSGLWVFEETANQSIVRGFRRWIESKQIQTKTARMMAKRGVRRAFILSWSGKPQWVIVSFEDWANQAREDLNSAS